MDRIITVDRGRRRQSGARGATAALATVLGALAVVAAALVGTARPASAATLQEVTSFGPNPTNLRMHLYVPNKVQQKAPVLVAVHYCTGSGQALYSGTEFASMADRYGFIVIYPTATRQGSCFDVSSPGALKHDGNSDPAGIVSMVRYVQQKYSTDTSRVFSVGLSSGAMMTNVLMGDYPDVFAGGSSFMGVPFGCFATTDGSSWNSTCSNGQLIKTPQEWANLVKAAYPGYSGPRPRMQIWHGTEDPTLRYPNFNEQIKQWTQVLGVGQTPVLTDKPQSSWTHTRYGDTGPTPPVEAYSIAGAGHSLPTSGMSAEAIRFLGLDRTGPTTSPTSGNSPTASDSPTPSDSPTTGGCAVTYTTNSWNTGLTAAVQIKNTGATTVEGWSLVFTLPAGQVISSGWNATYSPTSGQVTARNAGYNGTIAPGASVSIGFQASHGGDTGSPTSFRLNGSQCTVG